MEEISDPSGGHVDVDAAGKFEAVSIPGIPRDAAFGIFHMFVEMGYAVSLKHLGGYYFIEVPVALKGDPCHGKTAEIQMAAERSGLRAVQTGPTMRIIG